MDSRPGGEDTTDRLPPLWLAVGGLLLEPLGFVLGVSGAFSALGEGAWALVPAGWLTCLYCFHCLAPGDKSTAAKRIRAVSLIGLALPVVCLLAARLMMLFCFDFQGGRAFRDKRGAWKVATGRGVSSTGGHADHTWGARSEPIGAPLLKTRAEWMRDALAEHASVAAFSRLSLRLLAVGAPPTLVQRTHQAALEEVDHAERCFALGSDDESAAPGMFAAALWPDPWAGLSQQELLVRLAVESLTDGCLMEGFAADVAAWELSRSQDGRGTPFETETLEVITRDERGHAELAWAILAWCLRVGGEPVATAVHDASQRLPFSVPVARMVADGYLAADLYAVQRLFMDNRTQVRLRAEACLAAGSACLQSVAC